MKLSMIKNRSRYTGLCFKYMTKIPQFLGFFSILLIITLFSFIKKNNAHIHNQVSVRCAMPYWEQEKSFTSFRNNFSNCQYASVFWYYLDDQEQIQKYESADENTSIISFAHAHNIKILMTITNLPDKGDWDSKRVERMLDDVHIRQHHILATIALIERLHFDGVLIDYESINPSEKNNFSQFIGELSQKLHRKNKILAVSLHPKTKETLPDEDIGAFQDWTALATSADQVSIMAYDKHYDTGSPGPVAPLDWDKKIIEYAQSLHLPMNKVFLGISFFGFDWKVNTKERAMSVSSSDIQKIVKTYALHEQSDTISQSPFLTYQKDGNKHEVWYENSKSIAAKIQLAKDAHLGGITLWYLGEEPFNLSTFLEKSSGRLKI